MRDLRTCECRDLHPNGERACEPTCPQRFWDAEHTWRVRWVGRMDELRRKFPTLEEKYR